MKSPITNVRRNGVNQLTFQRGGRTYAVTNAKTEITTIDEKALTMVIRRGDTFEEMREQLRIFGCSLTRLHNAMGV